MQGVLLAAPPDGNVHVLGGVLCGAGAKAVETQGELVVLAVFVVVLTAGVQLAEHQLPVVAALLLVPVHRAAAAHVLHLHGLVQKAGDGDEAAVALAGFVDGVGEDFKHRVLAALQSVGAENHAGALPHTVSALQAGDTVVVVYVLLWHKGETSKGCRIQRIKYPIYCTAFLGAAQGACRRKTALWRRFCGKSLKDRQKNNVGATTASPVSTGFCTFSTSFSTAVMLTCFLWKCCGF